MLKVMLSEATFAAASKNCTPNKSDVFDCTLGTEPGKELDDRMYGR